MGKFKNLKGLKFNYLLAIEQIDKRDSSGSVFWKCKCDCGDKAIKARINFILKNIKDAKIMY